MYGRKRKYGKLTPQQRVAMSQLGAMTYLDAQNRPDRMRGSQWSRNAWGDTWKLANEQQRANRMHAGFYGRGDYHSTWKPFLQKWVPKGSLAALGGMAGGALGAPGLGSALGGAAANYLGWGKYKRRRKNFKGRGEYAGDAGGNQIMQGSVDTPITVNADEDDLSGDIYIAHREFLGNVTALGTGVTTPSAFNLVSYPINPGLSATFPWVSQIAENFTLYEPIGIIFEYKPTSGELGSASNALGKIVMGTQYDPDAPDFTNTVQMENYDYSKSCKPSEHMLHGVETACKSRATEMLYVRTGPSTKDAVFTDIGTFQIATEGLPVNVPAGTIVNVGELWVTYKFRFSRAQLYGTFLGKNINQAVLTSWPDGATSTTANTRTQLAVQPDGPFFQSPNLATLMATKLTNSLVMTGTSTGANSLRIDFPRNIVSGVYKVTCWLALPAAGTNTHWLNPGTFVNCAAILHRGYNNFTTITAPEIDLATPTQYMMVFHVNVTAPGTNVASFVLALATTNPPNNSQITVDITETDATSFP